MKNLAKLVKYELIRDTKKLAIIFLIVGIFVFVLGNRTGYSLGLILGFFLLLITENITQLKLTNVILLPVSFNKIFLVRLVSNLLQAFVFTSAYIYLVGYLSGGKALRYNQAIIAFSMYFYIGFYLLIILAKELLIRIKLKKRNAIVTFLVFATTSVSLFYFTSELSDLAINTILAYFLLIMVTAYIYFTKRGDYVETGVNLINISNSHR